MNPSEPARYSKFSDLPLQHLNTLQYSVYVLDFDWNYLFVNDYVKANLAIKGDDLIGKNMWKHFPELTTDPVFMLLKKNTESGRATNVIVTSPINSQRLNIVGYPLADSYYFTSTRLPVKENLLMELRKELKRN